MKRLLTLALILMCPLLAQQQSRRYTLTTDGSTAAFDNTNLGCMAWKFTFWNQNGGLSALTMTWQSSNDNATYTTFGGTSVAGTNPSTSTTSDFYTATGYYPYVRGNISGSSGTGTVQITIQCWTSPNYIALLSGAPPPPPPPGGVPATSGAISGCGIQYTGGLSFTIGTCTYIIAGTQYTSPLSTVTLTAADMTNPRIDLIAVNTSSAVVVVTGTAAGSPIAPTVDFSTELPLTFQTVAANASTPTGVTSTLLFDENVGPSTEWTCSSTSNVNCNSSTNPYHGSKDLEFTNAVLTNNVILTIGSSNINLQNYNNLVFYIRSKGPWPSGNNGSTAKKVLSIFWISSGTTQVGNQVTIQDGAFGFTSSSTSSYQQVSIPVGLFQTGSNTLTKLEFLISGNSGSSNVGFYIDFVTLQGGSVPGGNTNFLTFRGTWSSTASYNVNDVVASSGNGYVALLASTNVAVGTASTWQPLSTTATTTCTAPQFLIATSTCSTPVLTRNQQSAAYTTVLGDAGKMIQHPSTDNNARTFTIDSNANVAYPIGTCITFINDINTVTIAITSDTMTLMGSNTTGSRTLAVGNWATACKEDTTKWVIGGSSGLT